jgi:DNA-binding XRE family transcriptional regulator
LDGFIRMAEALVKFSKGADGSPAMGTDGAAPRGRVADRDLDAESIRKDVKAQDGGTVTPIDAEQVDADHFAFNEKASVNEDALVLINPQLNSATSVDIHVGQKIRQRRWMLGITKQQLADNVGVKLEQIKKYEAGAIHISASRMWDVAAAMEVPMSYFFEDVEGQASDTGEARGEILTDKEALAIVGGTTHARTVKAS